MSERRQWVRAAVILAIALAAGVGLPFVPAWTPGSDVEAAATSGMWLCPHGGGQAWNVTLRVANPGDTDVRITVRTYDSTGGTAEEASVVPAGTTETVTIAAPQRATASTVEYFGGWVAVGWVAVPEVGGVAAEPCVPRPSSSWYLPDLSSIEVEDDYLIVMNPYAGDAVFSVTLFAARSAPTRTDELTDVVLAGGRVAYVRIGDTLLGEDVVSAVVEAEIGRIAVATLGITTGGGIRAAVGYPSFPGDVVLPSGDDRGRSDLVMLFPETVGAMSGAVLSTEDERDLPDIATADVPDASTYAYPYSTLGASGLDVSSSGRGAASARSYAVGPDLGSTIGGVPARAWVVLPTVASGQAHPGIVLVNPGTSDVTVRLRVIGGSGAEVSVVVPARSAASPPASFLAAIGSDAVLATAGSGTFVAAGASSSRGPEGRAAYAVALGVPVPPRWIAG